ncbi:MAG: RNase adapter RapZ [Bradymonadaceae bacterium]|nr:RNase adapter RapZ [Lujinxingiaceae bacterium]
MEERSESAPTPASRVVVLTGLSGSGKSTAIRALEDIGFFCIDNLPVPLLPKVLELAGSGVSGRNALQNLAFVVDTRERIFLDQATDMIDGLRSEGVNVQVIFLEADDDVLVRRYSETRRRHPLSDGGTVREGIRLERETLSALREKADLTIDTTPHNVHSLKAFFHAYFSSEASASFTITLLSFGYKYGLPVECDLVFDLRFLPNPYFVEGMREKTGLVEAVKEYVLGFPETGRFISLFQEMGEFILPMYEREGKSYLTIGIGCTGGRHRSVAVSEAIAERLRGRGWKCGVRHRDVGRG